jgi:hypothetical protein
MADYLLLMHDDAPEATQGWDDDFRGHREAGVFQGGTPAIRFTIAGGTAEIRELPITG